MEVERRRAVNFLRPRSHSRARPSPAEDHRLIAFAEPFGRHTSQSHWQGTHAPAWKDGVMCVCVFFFFGFHTAAQMFYQSES